MCLSRIACAWPSLATSTEWSQKVHWRLGPKEPVVALCRAGKGSVGNLFLLDVGAAGIAGGGVAVAAIVVIDVNNKRDPRLEQDCDALVAGKFSEDNGAV